jgi:hypothetical protein
VSKIDQAKHEPGVMMCFGNIGEFRRAVIVYSFSIRSGDGGGWEFLGCTDLLNDYAARAFGNDVIRDMLQGNADQYPGWSMDIGESGRAVCSIAFPFPSQGRRKTKAAAGVETSATA